MNRNSITIRPGKFQALIGFIAGCIFCVVGAFIIIPDSGIFGILWTTFAVLFTIAIGRKAFSGKQKPNQMMDTEETFVDPDLSNFYTESEVEERLIHLKDLYDKKLISNEDYKKKKEEILKHL